MSNTVELYSVKQGGLVDWELSVDANGEILATSDNEFLKFPANITKGKLNKLFLAHNEQNEGKVALTGDETDEVNETIKASQKLVDSL